MYLMKEKGFSKKCENASYLDFNISVIISIC